MRARSPNAAMAALLALALSAHATTVGKTTLGKLTSGADRIVVGKVARVVEVPAGANEPTVRVAEVDVLDWLKGDERPAKIWYLAEGTHGADVSDAINGERALLFLRQPVKEPEDDGGICTRLRSPVFRENLKKMTGGAPLLDLSRSGYGRAPLETVEGVEYAAILWLVCLPPDMTTIPAAIPAHYEIERRVPLDTLKAFIKRRLSPAKPAAGEGVARVLNVLEDLDSTTDPWPSEEAADQLHEWREDAVAVLLDLLSDPTFPRRDTVAEALFWIGEDGTDALHEALSSEDVRRRRGAAFALEWAAATEFVDSVEVTPEAVQAARYPDPDPEFRARMVAALARGGGTDENEPVEAAAGALGDESLRVRRAAARTIARLWQLYLEDLEPGKAEAALLPHVTTEDKDFRREVWEALSYVAGPRTLLAVPKALDDPDRVVRVLAVLSLGRIRIPEATERLIPLLESKDPWVRRCAAFALGTAKAVRAVAPLTKALADPDRSVVRCAIDALGEIGPLAAAAVPALEKLRETSEDPGIGSDVEDALEKLRE